LFRPIPPAIVVRHFQSEHDETIAECVLDLLDAATDQILYQCPDEQLMKTVSQRLTAAPSAG
jgi:uncharacterized FlaG/YvyC family protein